MGGGDFSTQLSPAPADNLSMLSATALTELLFVPHCPACDQRMGTGQALCPTCSISLYELDAACPRCAEPMTGPLPVTCARCRRQPPPFTAMTSPYRYGGELAVALRRLKYQPRPDIARTLAPLFANALAAALTDIDRVVAVPLHWRRRWQRGFNQAVLLAQHAIPDLAIDRLSLRRLRSTQPQSALPARARIANVSGVFAVPRRRRKRIAGHRILLVDDVVTTGATMAAAARALLAAGAREVQGFGFARAEAP